MYTLTSLDPVACFGTSFPTLAAAKNYAIELREEFGLCPSFSIGMYRDGKHVEVYCSHKEVKSDGQSLDR